MDETTYFIWHIGDPSVGIAGEQAEATMRRPMDAREDRYNRDALRECFASLWDADVHVMGSDEMAAEDDEPDHDERDERAELDDPNGDGT